MVSGRLVLPPHGRGGESGEECPARVFSSSEEECPARFSCHPGANPPCEPKKPQKITSAPPVLKRIPVRVSPRHSAHAIPPSSIQGQCSSHQHLDPERSHSILHTTELYREGIADGRRTPAPRPLCPLALLLRM